MDHVVYVDSKSNELELILNGKKNNDNSRSYR